MAQNELKKELQRMMQKCPQCLTPRKIYRYTPLSENRIYELIRTGELPSFIYQGTYVVNKDDVIEYLLNHSKGQPQIQGTTEGERTWSVNADGRYWTGC